MLLIDEDLLEAIADAYLSIKEQWPQISMAFEDAVCICQSRKTTYSLQIELLRRADHYHEKRRLRSAYSFDGSCAYEMRRRQVG